MGFKLAACAAASLSFQSCLATIERVETFVPTSVKSEHEHIYGPGHPLQRAFAFRLSGDSREVCIHTGGGDLYVNIDYRRAGIYMGGLVLPVIPLFGLFSESEDWRIIVDLAYDSRLKFDAEDVRIRNVVTGNEPLVVASQPFGGAWPHFHTDETRRANTNVDWRTLSIAFDATYAGLDEFDVEVMLGFPVQVDGTTQESVEVVRIHYDKCREVYWDTGFYGTGRYSDYLDRQ